jgi:hypothetical protein
LSKGATNSMIMYRIKRMTIMGKTKAKKLLLTPKTSCMKIAKCPIQGTRITTLPTTKSWLTAPCGMLALLLYHGSYVSGALFPSPLVKKYILPSMDVVATIRVNNKFVEIVWLGENYDVALGVVRVVVFGAYTLNHYNVPHL